VGVRTVTQAGVWLAWLGTVAPAWAQAPTADGDGTAANPVDLARKEFSLETTGQLQQPAPVRNQAAIEPPAPVPSTPPPEDRAAPPAEDTPAPVMALDSNMGTRVNEVLACRMEIAAERRVPADKVVAGAVTLRWTVQADGRVDDPEVVALRDTDPDVLVCVKRKLAGWSFPRPGAVVRFERNIRFP
jgi:hypothetical protein